MPALYQWSSQGWETYPYSEFRIAAEELALGLIAQAWHKANSASQPLRVGLLLESNIHWALADMGSLLAGLVTVPLDREQSLDTLNWIVADAELRALVVATWDRLQPLYNRLQQIELVVIIDESPPPSWVLPLSDKVVIKTLADIRRQGQQRHSPVTIQSLKERIHPEDLATIVYTADASGSAKGAMLSHQSLTGNIWAAFSSMPGLMPGTPEIALSFLPLNHIFARAFLYGHLGFGHHIYFSSPKRVFRHLATVQPTIFITVPRLLEKVYERVNSLRQQSFGLKRQWLQLGWYLAHRYNINAGHLPWYRLQCWLLGHGVFKSLRRAFGGNIRYLLCGGAALRSEVMTFFNGMGIPVKQGYGLTETSSVLSYTRDRWLRSGTVGTPIPGVEMRLANDGEVLVKSPYTMAGYHHNQDATDAVIDADGWFHTGDLGEFSADGLLTLHGCKKGLFKLSTGKYVAPDPIEAQLENSPLVKQALLVGPGQKFCGVLIVPEDGRLDDGTVRSHYQSLIDQVNSQLPHWSTIKRFALVQLKANTQISRQQRYQAHSQDIKNLYQETDPVLPPTPVSPWHREWTRLKALYHRARQPNTA
ncbi:MAG: AMP-binding protein [Cyanobacteria bacterium P01_F01_bin.13]